MGMVESEETTSGEPMGTNDGDDPLVAAFMSRIYSDPEDDTNISDQPYTSPIKRAQNVSKL